VEAFPFTKAEWIPVRETLLSLVNATLAEDDILRSSYLAEVLELLAALKERHGDHPVLLETEADFIDEEDARVELYRRAAGIATANVLSTLSIRLSLAQVLLELGRPAEAAVELTACEQELPDGDDSDRESWKEMAAKAKVDRGDAVAE